MQPSSSPIPRPATQRSQTQFPQMESVLLVSARRAVHPIAALPKAPLRSTGTVPLCPGVDGVGKLEDGTRV